MTPFFDRPYPTDVLKGMTVNCSRMKDGKIQKLKERATWPKVFKDFTKEMLYGFGKPCEAYEPDCPSCKAWGPWRVLAGLLEDREGPKPENIGTRKDPYLSVTYNKRKPKK